MSFFDPEMSFGPDEARNQISIYGAELAAMAAVAVRQYENFDPPAAVICERGTSEGDSLGEYLDPRVPIRVVEDGSTIAVIPRDALRKLVRIRVPECEPYLDRPEFAGPGIMPILAVCKKGSLMGSVEYERSA